MGFGFLFAGLDKGDGEQSEHSPYLHRLSNKLFNECTDIASPFFL